MADDFDDFTFDNDTDDGFGNIGETSDEDSSSEFGEFGGQVQTANEVSSGKSTVVKQAIIIVIIAAVVVLLAFVVIQWLTGGTKKTESVDKTPSSVTEVAPPVQNETSGGWTKFDNADGLTFNEEYISAVFTVTGVKHYLNVVDNEKNLMVKTVITGSLSGFIGAYEMDIPYSKGCRLSIGNTFDVEVQVGNSNGKTVVGEINY